ncbi:MAG TPA: hypothetical protein VKR29_00430 [Candidatus Binataceae bacterium]|jgi:hypothetical protein|nr:hypothetical protein [Candidatus Binataceae bacterium]
MMKKMTAVASILTALTLGGFVFAGSGHAEDQWQRNHQGRVEVNSRLRRQDRRINAGERRGQLNGAEAQQLHQEDQSIRNQERQDAAANNGHLTGGERRQLNREENAESRQIYQDRHNGY